MDAIMYTTPTSTQNRHQFVSTVRNLKFFPAACCVEIYGIWSIIVAFKGIHDSEFNAPWALSMVHIVITILGMYTAFNHRFPTRQPNFCVWVKRTPGLIKFSAFVYLLWAIVAFGAVMMMNMNHYQRLYLSVGSAFVLTGILYFLAATYLHSCWRSRYIALTVAQPEGLQVGSEHPTVVQLAEIVIQADDKCVICLQTFPPSVCKLECGHVYCPPCIIKWREQSNKCPLCRRQQQ